jgi:hypothetical protein
LDERFPENDHDERTSMAVLKGTATYTSPFGQANTFLFLEEPLFAFFGGVDDDVIVGWSA